MKEARRKSDGEPVYVRGLDLSIPDSFIAVYRDGDSDSQYMYDYQPIGFRWRDLKDEGYDYRGR
jgi:hypothetical protein